MCDVVVEGSVVNSAGTIPKFVEVKVHHRWERVLFRPSSDGFSKGFVNFFLRWKDLVLQRSRRDGCQGFVLEVQCVTI